MVYIKKLVMYGFKSFAKRTEVLFDKHINVVIGPNGSGKSNVADALCFVLGRLSIKSMRAAKASNLIFMGSKFIKPSREAVVELFFDNSDRAFSTGSDEVVLERIVRRNGQSIYKLNGEIKTRAEIIELLAQAGIDPHGFNLVLQGQIQSVVRMHPEERRRVVEEVAGISIYESRKEKSLRELEKTEEKLKEISTILRERTSYLKNLEKEKEQAEKYKELEMTIKRAKAGILAKKIQIKKNEIGSVNKSVEEKTKGKDKIKEKSDNLKNIIEKLTEEINQINRNLKETGGIEQENLHNEIANLKAEIEGQKVRKENYENRFEESEKRIFEMSNQIPEIQKEIKELKGKSPLMAKKADELRKKKEELAEIESERKKIIAFKGELNSARDKIKDRERQLTMFISEGEHLIKQIEDTSSGFSFREIKECQSAISSFKDNLTKIKKELIILSEKTIEKGRIIAVSDSEIKRVENLKKEIEKIDVCPLCQSKMTENHISHVFRECQEKINLNKDKKETAETELKDTGDNLKESNLKLKDLEEGLRRAEIELIGHFNIKEKKERLKKIVDEQNSTREEIKSLENKINSLETKSDNLGQIEEKYERKIMEIEEISSRTEDDVDTTLLYKERELENINNVIKRSKNDIEELKNTLMGLSEDLSRKIKVLSEKEEKEKKLNEKFKKMFEEREKVQSEIQSNSISLTEVQSEIRQIEEQIGYLRIGKAKLDAEEEALNFEISDFAGIEILQGSIQYLEERLRKAQESIQTIGSINMRALEVYQEIKKEYDLVYEKVQTIEKEKEDILRIIEEIDKKKKKEFMKTFNDMNELFTSNFSKLSSKGHAYLEIENKEDIFSGGVNIIVRLAKGKYFDVSSLSGGEQTLIALSLIFAIQEYKPYHFYVFDEIDAALDKRNSERLAGLINQYMKSGQYIVVTHNDALIMNSNILYGVSMHEGVSKILSLKIKAD